MKIRALASFATCAALWAAVACAEPVQLKLGFPPPPGSFMNTHALAPWAKELEEATRGEVKVQIYVGGTLATYNNVLDRVLNNVADIGYGMFGPLGNQFPRSGVTQLPFVEEATSVEISTALWRLYESGVIAEEYVNVKPLSLSVFIPSGYLGTKPVRNLDDLKGMKVSVGSRVHGQIVEIVGGAPISMPATELYQSLQRGLVDAGIMGWAATAAYKLHEVARYYVDAPLGNSGKFVVMNKDAYAKLSEDSRAAIDRLSGVKLSRRMAAATAEESEHGRDMVKALPGHTITVSGADEFAKWRPRMAPLIDEWVKTTPDGARVLAAYRTEVAKARAENR